MCGIAGFVSYGDGFSLRERIILAGRMGVEIDSRGGHGAGYVGVTNTNEVRYGRRPNYWAEASVRMISSVATCDRVIMHARYATCGKRTIEEAHPFAIRRDGRTRLWGAHNGIIYDADESAAAHGRSHPVDSVEVLELLADKEYAKISNLGGYGTLAWVEASNRDAVRLVKMTKNADLEIAHVAGKGAVFGSTRNIVKEGIKRAGLKLAHWYQLDTGKVYELDSKGVFTTKERVELKEWSRVSYRASDWMFASDLDSEFDNALLADERFDYRSKIGEKAWYRSYQEYLADKYGDDGSGDNRDRGVLHPMTSDGMPKEEETDPNLSTYNEWDENSADAWDIAAHENEDGSYEIVGARDIPGYGRMRKAGGGQ